eukprot:s3989_g4.t1
MSMTSPMPPVAQSATYGFSLVDAWTVRVDGLKFEYQLTEDDVRKAASQVFSRYGEVVTVKMDREGTTSQVQFAQPHQAMAAQHDLDKKQLQGMSGAFLTVEFAYPQGPAKRADLGHRYPVAPAPTPSSPTPSPGGQPKKFTCKLEVGIENEGEFRVGSREPLALCISCRDQTAFDKAVQYAETQLQKVHSDYKAFCQQHGKPVPDLEVKISKKGTFGPEVTKSVQPMNRGERPAGAPTDEEIERLIEERNDARKAANFKKADEVREHLKSRGQSFDSVSGFQPLKAARVVLMDEKGAKGTFKGSEVTKKKCSAVVSVAYIVAACVAHGFEVFSEQQLLVLNDPTRVIDFNNSEYGSTHVDDYWAKIDLNYSPLEGWNLFRHVRIGCFLVQWESALAYAERVGETLTATECVQFCNRTQAYLRLPLCRCGLDETALPMIEVQGECTPTSWEVYREFDYRSSMSPSTYDVTRRLLYSIVTIRLPSPADPPLRNYIHAVNPLESRPQFDYDTRLDRMVFNAVWDFGKSRMVALSLSDWGGTLDLTVALWQQQEGDVQLCISGLEVRQSHFPIEDQIVANGELVRDGLASVEGLGTVDILFGTYYTVVPATWSSSTQVVHVVVAIDIDMKRVLTSVVMPVTLMNLQMNSLTHQLYGAGADLNDQYAYYQLCTAANLTQTVGGVTTVQVFVSCTLAELGGLPSEVNYMYLQSAAIDHQFNYAWFTFKEEPTGTPRILEYQHDSKDYVLWPQDSRLAASWVQLEASSPVCASSVARIIFALYPPALQYARFNTAGTKLFLSFDAATLRGAVPIDTNGDDIPDFYNEADKATRGPCEDFIDRFTMILIPGSMCQWTTDADFYVEIQPASTIAPGDLARIKPGTVYRGQEARAGLYQFSQPSSDFAVVEAPLDIPTPRAEVGGLAYIDVCTELVLDGTQSRDHGFRGAFTWALSSTTPEKSHAELPIGLSNGG